MPETAKKERAEIKLSGQQQIKMKEIHKPSSFEGALWAAQGIIDARVIYHAPPGCYLMQHMNSICNDFPTSDTHFST